MDTRPPTRPLSISQVRLFLSCSHAWHLRYRLGHVPRVGAGAWFGRMIHEAIQLAYQGLALDDAVRATWETACAPIFDALEELVTLDAEYAAAGRPTSKAAQAWRDQHPAYDELARRVNAYQAAALGHLRWGKTQSLADYYRRAVVLGEREAEILIDDPILIEGRPFRTVEDDEPPAADSAGDDAPFDEEGKAAYSPLVGVIGGVAVAGVPDIVARRGDTALVGDYKTGRPLGQAALLEDAQLTIYVELLRQNGIIAAGQPVEVSHIVLGEREVTHQWAPASDHARLLSRIERQLAHVAALVAADLTIPRKGIDAGFLSPCALCDVAHVCDA